MIIEKSIYISRADSSCSFDLEKLSSWSIWGEFFLAVGDEKIKEIKLNKEEAEFLIKELTNFVNNK